MAEVRTVNDVNEDESLGSFGSKGFETGRNAKHASTGEGNTLNAKMLERRSKV